MISAIFLTLLMLFALAILFVRRQGMQSIAFEVVVLALGVACLLFFFVPRFGW